MSPFRSRAPLDYATGRAGLPDPPPAGADVVVPVYGALPEFRRCLASLLRHTDLARHGLILVLDGPGQDAAARAVAESGAANVHVLSNERRAGFVKSANRGMSASRRDVVLLNSDTEVTAGWLDKLQAAAYSAPEVASATPFSNDATLCSLPEPFEANRLPAGHDADSFARLVESASRREYPRLPTGVGVCLYLKRRALDQVGGFDEQAFGLGYGEENDFCFRALEAGFVHVLDDAGFVFHAGHRSFGDERRRLMRRAAVRLQLRHPRYVATIAAFMRADPAAPARRRVIERLALESQAAARGGAPATAATGGPRRVLHVVHGWPPFSRGGAETYAAWLARRQAELREVAVYARLSDPSQPPGAVQEYRDGALRVRLAVNDFTQRDPLARNALRNRALEADFARLLDAFRPDLVHVHHLAGHALGLVNRLRARAVPFVLQLQDWWPACARTNLALPDGSLCTGPALRKCARCFPMTRLPPAGLPNLALHALRRAWMRRLLRAADALVAGSRFVADSYERFGLLDAGARIHVLPYGIEPPGPQPPAGERTFARPLRFGCVGPLMPHKGAHVAVEAFAGIDPAEATLDLWGADSAAPDYARHVRAAAGPSVRLHAPFEEADKARLLGGLHALIVPSVGLESFGLVAREALWLGVPVIASRLGALTELMDEGHAIGFEAGDVASLRATIDNLLADPRQLLACVPAARPKTMEAHAAEIESLYASVLGRLSATRRA